MADVSIGTGPALPPFERPRREHRRAILGPAILIGLGLLFLAQNLGLLSADFWLDAWRFWPLLLVAAGIGLILGRWSWGATIGVVILVVAVAAVGVGLSVATQVSRWSVGDWRFGAAAPAGVERIVEELGDARQATVELRHGAGRLSIGSLSSDSNQLLDAELAHGENTGVDRNVDRLGGQTFVQLRGRNNRGFMPVGGAFREDWAINLSPNVPIDLRVRSGASDLDLNLQELKVTRLDVQAGASALKITLPQAAGRTEARIQAGAAGVRLIVPAGVAARINVRGGLSGATIDEARFPRVGKYYQSLDYGTAPNAVELDVETGVSGLTIR